MPRRRKTKPSLLSPASNFLKRISDGDSRLRRRLVKICAWSLALFFIYTCMSGTYGFPRIIRLKMEKDALMDANRRQLVQLADDLRIRSLLKTDPSYIEYIARSRYHMAATNETIYRYGGR